MSPAGRTRDGTWQVGVRRTLPLDAGRAWTVLTGILDGDPAVRRVRSRTPGVVMRVEYDPGGWARPSTLQLRVLPARTGTTLAIHHEGLPDAATRAAMRARWTSALEAL